MKVNLTVTDEKGNIYHGEVVLVPSTENRSLSQRQSPRTQQDYTGIEQAQATTLDAASVANKVNEAETYGQIEQHILNNPSRLAKVLLAFHFAHECGFEQLTSGDVEKITNELGIKIKQPSASHCISDYRKLFNTSATRHKGAKLMYKLNHQGEQAYKKVLETGKA